MVEERVPPDLLTLPEVAEILKLHRNTIEKWARAGLIPSVRVGPAKRAQYRFHRADIEQLLRTGGPHA